jgi:hypothetical protein
MTDDERGLLEYYMKELSREFLSSKCPTLKAQESSQDPRRKIVWMSNAPFLNL